MRVQCFAGCTGQGSNSRMWQDKVQRERDVCIDCSVLSSQALKALVSLDNPESLRESHTSAWTEVLPLAG